MYIIYVIYMQTHFEINIRPDFSVIRQELL